MTNWLGKCVFAAGVALAVGCERQEAEIPAVPIHFAEVAQEVGLRFEHRQLDGTLDYVSETTAPGVVWFDFDNDGDWDVYAVNGSGQPNALYRNDGGTFVEIGSQAGAAHRGFGMGAAAADFDGDGWTDIYVTNFNERNVLYRNTGHGTFEDVTTKAGVGGKPGEWSTSAAWADVDGDGDLDLYVARYLDFSNPSASEEQHLMASRDEPMTLRPDPYAAQANTLYRNNGDGTFTDVTEQAGVADAAGKGLGVVFGDYDNDGDSDFYVANDTVPNALFRNRGDGTFEEVSFAAGVDDARGSMGVDWGDYDGDGDLDLFVTNWEKETNALYRNSLVRSDKKPASESFDDVTLDAGLGHTSLGYTGWGTHFADFDNDGDLDLFVANGYTSPDNGDPTVCRGERNLLYRNDDGKFTELKEAFAFTDWGAGRGSAVADYDNDGDVDILVAQNNGRLLLFRNETGNERGWVNVRAPVGTRIEVKIGKKTTLREITGGSSYLSTNAAEVLLGVPVVKSVREIVAVLPGGKRQSVKKVPVRSRVTFEVSSAPDIAGN